MANKLWNKIELSYKDRIDINSFQILPVGGKNFYVNYGGFSFHTLENARPFQQSKSNVPHLLTKKYDGTYVIYPWGNPLYQHDPYDRIPDVTDTPYTASTNADYDANSQLMQCEEGKNYLYLIGIIPNPEKHVRFWWNNGNFGYSDAMNPKLDFILTTNDLGIEGGASQMASTFEEIQALYESLNITSADLTSAPLYESVITDDLDNEVFIGPPNVAQENFKEDDGIPNYSFYIQLVATLDYDTTLNRITKSKQYVHEHIDFAVLPNAFPDPTELNTNLDGQNSNLEISSICALNGYPDPPPAGGTPSVPKHKFELWLMCCTHFFDNVGDLQNYLFKEFQPDAEGALTPQEAQEVAQRIRDLFDEIMEANNNENIFDIQGVLHVCQWRKIKFECIQRFLPGFYKVLPWGMGEQDAINLQNELNKRNNPKFTPLRGDPGDRAAEKSFCLTTKGKTFRL